MCCKKIEQAILEKRQLQEKQKRVEKSFNRSLCSGEFARIIAAQANNR